MSTLADSFLASYKNANTILLLLNEHVPAQLALWYPVFVSVAKAEGKHVDILVASEGKGWVAQVDRIFPVDMLLQIEDLTQKIKIPYTGAKENFGTISYSVGEDNVFEISVIPKEGVLNLDQVKTESSGSKYDLIIGVGISARHPLIEKVRGARIATMGAPLFVFGTVASVSGLKNSLAHLGDISVVQEQVNTFLFQTIYSLMETKSIQGNTALFANALALYYALQPQYFGADSLHKELYAAVGAMPLSQDVTTLATSVYSFDGKEEKTIELLLQSAKTYSNGECRVYRIGREQLEALGVSFDEALTIARQLPLSQAVTHTVVLVSLTSVWQYVHVQSDIPAKVKEVASKYSFAVADSVTTGEIKEISTQKVETDIVRILTGEDVAPASVAVEQQKPAAHVVVPVLQKLEEEEVLGVDDEDVDSKITQEQVSPQGVPVVAPEPITPVPVSRPPENIPVSSGLDFASIAQKMRDSITH